MTNRGKVARTRNVWRVASVCLAGIGLCGYVEHCALSAVPPVRYAATAGFERVQVPSGDGHSFEGAFWYPSTSPPALMSLFLTEQIVAEHGVLSGQNLPLIVVSHGAFGTWREHSDTAIALARSGFVVAALTHDDFDTAGVLKLVRRRGQLSQLIDFALRGWRGHASLNSNEIGAFGFSIGGFTVLVAAGARPELSRIPTHCLAAPKEWSCVLAAEHHLDLAMALPPPENWSGDPRIKAAVIAAPALGYVFGQAGLAPVRMPLQLWQAGADSALAEPWNAEAVKRDLPRPADYHLIEAADHGDFTAPCVPSAVLAAPKPVP